MTQLAFALVRKPFDGTLAIGWTPTCHGWAEVNWQEPSARAAKIRQSYLDAASRARQQRREQRRRKGAVADPGRERE